MSLGSIATHVLVGCAVAAPLDPDSCAKVKVEQAALADVPAVMERGPDWAKANASPEMLQKIARWVELGETLAFRCGVGTITAEARRAAAAAERIENPPPDPTEPTTTGGEADKKGPAAPTSTKLSTGKPPTGPATPAASKSSAATAKTITGAAPAAGQPPPTDAPKPKRRRAKVVPAEEPAQAPAQP